MIKGAKAILDIRYIGTLEFPYNRIGNLPLMLTSEPKISGLNIQDSDFFSI